MIHKRIKWGEYKDCSGFLSTFFSFPSQRGGPQAEHGGFIRLRRQCWEFGDAGVPGICREESRKPCRKRIPEIHISIPVDLLLNTNYACIDEIPTGQSENYQGARNGKLRNYKYILFLTNQKDLTEHLKHSITS